MNILFTNITILLFAIGDLIWLIQIWKMPRIFSALEKLRSVSFAFSFFLGLLWTVLSENPLGAYLCLAGLVISQFTIAVTFYENYKGLEIPHE